VNQLYAIDFTGAPHCGIKKGEISTSWGHFGIIFVGVNRGTVDSMASFSKQLEHSSGDSLADIAHNH